MRASWIKSERAHASCEPVSLTQTRNRGSSRKVASSQGSKLQSKDGSRKGAKKTQRIQLEFLSARSLCRAHLGDLPSFRGPATHWVPEIRAQHCGPAALGFAEVLEIGSRGVPVCVFSSLCLCAFA